MKSENYSPKHIPADLNFTDKEYEQIERLTSADVARIDNWLMSFAIRKGRKVAFLVMSTMGELANDLPNIPDTFYILRVQKLIEEGRLELDGDMDFWRQSEVLLPKGEIEWK
ncbi:MAG: hypothetical protein H7070_01540 [Saprospiraceae bacterium]|nr:hypothetical protein [Pyrinomonadaceae bacterium]